jgi:DNA mismatch repair protein MutS2
MAEFVRRDVPVVATTHHRSVAEYAGHADGVENASMELDPVTHLPTYHLVIGVPGRSYALAIARHLGLPEGVLEQAEALVGSEHRDAERLLLQLQGERRKLAEVASEAEQERSGAERLRRELEGRLAEIGRRQDEMIDETQRELRREAEEMRRELRRIERDARLAGHHAAARRAAEGARRRLRDPDWIDRVRRGRKTGDGEKADESTADAPAAEAPIESLAPGDVVELKGLGARAEVQSVDENGTVQLLIGGATARIDIAEVRRLEGVKIASPEPARYTVDAEAHGEGASDEIDLRGVRAHEVEPALAAFLDRCALNGVEMARVVHGRGTGAVREAVREFLARSPAAAAFQPADRDHGGDAVTVVELA